MNYGYRNEILCINVDMVLFSLLPKVCDKLKLPTRTLLIMVYKIALVSITSRLLKYFDSLC